MYDPLLNNWITKTAMITPVSGAGVVVLTDTIHILGGFGISNTLNASVQIYDPASNSWSVGTPMLEARSGFGAALLNGKIYAIGGVTAGGITTNTVEIYDPVTDLWTSGPPLPESRASMAVVVRQGKIYVVGGTDNWSGGTPQNTAFVLDPGLGAWTTVNPMPTSRYATDGAVISDTIYVIGGVGDLGASTANEGFGFLPISSILTIDSDNPDPSRLNQPFTVGYSVTATGEIPTGVVTVTVGSRPESCSGLLVNGLGSCQLAIDALGTYTLTATYGGNHILLGSSDTETHVVELFKLFLPVMSRE
jgi:N-acetylneuraminic acid mutarotase